MVSSDKLNLNLNYTVNYQDPKPGFEIEPYLKVGAIGFGAMIGLVNYAINLNMEGYITGNPIADMAIIGLVIFEIDFIFFNTLPLDFLK